MIGDRIRELRQRADISQAELARRLSVTRTSVNAWESGLSAPTAVYIVELSRLFHVSSDFLLELDSSQQISLAGLDPEETAFLYWLLNYFQKHRGQPDGTSAAE